MLLEPDAPLPLPDNTFDLVLCAETLEHVRDVQLLLSEARRVLIARRRGWRSPPRPMGAGTGLDVLLRGFERRFDPLSPHLRFFSAPLAGTAAGRRSASTCARRSASDGILLALATR